MNKDKTKSLVRILTFIASCAVLVGLIANYRYGQTAPGGPLYVADYTDITGHAGPLTEVQRWAMALADGLMSIGVVVAGVGCMTWVATTGLFDTLGYGASVLWDRITFRNRGTKFYDYKVAKQEARKKTKPARSIILVGAAMLLLSGVCTVIFYL